MGNEDDPGEDSSARGPTSLAFSNTTPSQSQSISCKSCTLQFIPSNSRYKYCTDWRAKISSRPKASATKRDSSTALFSLKDTYLSKQHKDDNFPFQFNKDFGQFPTMKGFHQSKNERYRVVDLVTAINNNIGFRVCKWTGVPEKRVQSFAFYMGDAQPKHTEKGVE
jgi:hypothetical protein